MKRRYLAFRLISLLTATMLLFSSVPVHALAEAFFSEWFRVDAILLPIQISEETAEVSYRFFQDKEELPENGVIKEGEKVEAEIQIVYLEEQGPTPEILSFTYELPEYMNVEDTDWESFPRGKYRIAEQNLEIEYDALLLDSEEDVDLFLIPFVSNDSLPVDVRMHSEMYSAKGTELYRTLAESEEGAKHVSDLSRLIYTIGISKNGEEQDVNQAIIVREGDEFDVQLSFQETETVQFLDDNTEPMYIDLPQGFEVPVDFATTVDVTINVGGNLVTVYNNPISYDHINHRLNMTWNNSDPNFSSLVDSGDTSIYMALKGKFNVSEATELAFGPSHKINVGPPNNPKVAKSAEYNKDTKTITYDVVVTAEGPVTMPLTVTDDLEGVALIYQHDVMQAAIEGKESVPNRSDLTVTDHTNGFVISIPAMTDGEQLHFTYTARVDIEKLEVSGSTEKETVNTVQISNPENEFNDLRDDQATTAQNIEVADIEKKGTRSEQYDGEDGVRYQDITWTVTTNSEAAAKFGGSVITDTLEYDPAYVTMSTKNAGIVVRVTDRVEENGENVEKLIEVREVPWSQLNVIEFTVPENPDDPDSKEMKQLQWTYNIPETDESYCYEVTYVTRANISNMKAADTVHNTAVSKGGGDQADVIIGPTGDRNIHITKKAERSDEQTITWDIETTAFAEGHDSYVITEILPIKWIQMPGETSPKPFKDTFDSIEVISGLYEGEHIDWEVISRDTYNADRVRITFHKNESENGLLPKTTYPEDKTDRSIKLRLVTKNNQEWVDRSTSLLGTNNWYALHENRAEVRADKGYDFDTARTAVARLSIRKDQDKVAYSTEVIDGVSFPVYRFVLYVSGVTEDVLNERGELVITDVPALEHPEYWTVYENQNPDDWRNVRGYVYEEAYYPNLSLGARYVGNAPAAEADKVAGGTMTYNRAEDGTITFTMGDLPKRKVTDADGNETESFWPFHDVIYFMIPKDEEALTAIRQMAMADPKTNGKLALTNTASVKDKHATYDYEYSYQPMGKKLSAFGRNTAYYKITLNADGMRLNDGKPLEMTDTFSDNLSVDYSSIHVTASGKGSAQEVSWDYRGNIGTFTIPDETAVTITYKAAVTGRPGEDVSFWNTVGFANFTQTLEEKKTMSAVSGGSAGVYQLRLFKYADAHMETGLAGATFRLLDANKIPVRYLRGDKKGQEVTFTTDQTGYATVTLSQNRDGLSIRKNTVYYLEEINAPVVNENGETVYYHKDHTYYSFVISDNPDYNAGDIWVYSNGDILKVRNYKDQGGLYISKRFAGNINLTTEQQNDIRFILQRKDSGSWETIKTYSYQEFTDGSIHISSEDLSAGKYRVVEENPTLPGCETNVECVVDGETMSPQSAEFEIKEGETGSHSVAFTNTYIEHKYTIRKKDSQSGAVLAGAVFTVYSSENTEITQYTTDAEGVINITYDESLYLPGVLYYAVETSAPQGYILPTTPEKLYFYFGDQPDIREDINAINLTTSFGNASVENEADHVDVPVAKTWGTEESDVWPDSVKSIDIGLYRQIGDGDTETVLKDGAPWVITLDAAHPYDFSTFRKLPAVTEDGQLITYSVRELTVTSSDGTVHSDPSELYEITGGERENTGYYILNNAPHRKQITVKKAWYEKKLDGTVVSTSAPRSSEFTLYRTVAGTWFKPTDGAAVTYTTGGTGPKEAKIIGFDEGKIHQGDVLHLTYASPSSQSIDKNWKITSVPVSGPWQELTRIPIPGRPMECFLAVPNNCEQLIFILYSGDNWGHEYTLTIENTSMSANLTMTDAVVLTTGESAEIVDTFALAGNEVYKRDDLDATDSAGEEYYYFVVEKNAAEDTVYEFDSDIITAKNYIKEPRKTNLVVQKEWFSKEGVGIEDKAALPEITYELYRTTDSIMLDGESLAELSKNASGKTSFTSPSIIAKPGDELDIRFNLESRSEKDKGVGIYNLEGIRVNGQSGRLKIISLTDDQGKDVSTLLRDNDTRFEKWNNNATKSFVIIARVKIPDDIETVETITAGGYSGSNATISIRNVTAVERSKAREETLLAIAEEIDSYKTGKLNATNHWTETYTEVEQETIYGQPYHYFVLEKCPAGYSVRYAIDGNILSMINVENDDPQPSSITVDIGGVKVLQGRDLKAGEFTFVIEPADSNLTSYPGLSGERPSMTVTNSSDGEFHFLLIISKEDLDKITHSDPAVLTYVVYEKHAGEIIDGVKYSTQKFWVQVKISKDGDRILQEAQIQIFESDPREATKV